MRGTWVEGFCGGIRAKIVERVSPLGLAAELERRRGGARWGGHSGRSSDTFSGTFHTRCKLLIGLRELLTTFTQANLTEREREREGCFLVKVLTEPANSILGSLG